jgi:hypothetical protein
MYSLPPPRGALMHLLCACAGCVVFPVTASDYVYLGCIADESDVTTGPHGYAPGAPGLESLLLESRATPNGSPTKCASVAKQAGKRFFGLQGRSCRAGSSLIRALRHSDKPGQCTTLCAPDNICRGGHASIEQGGPVATGLYVLKTGKGECLCWYRGCVCRRSQCT